MIQLESCTMRIWDRTDPSPRWICLKRLNGLYLPRFEIRTFFLLDWLLTKAKRAQPAPVLKSFYGVTKNKNKNECKQKCIITLCIKTSRHARNHVTTLKHDGAVTIARRGTVRRDRQAYSADKRAVAGSHPHKQSCSVWCYVRRWVSLGRDTATEPSLS